MKERQKSLLPIYGMGIIFVVYALVFPMYRWTDLAIALAVAVLAHIVLGKLFPGTEIEVEMSYSSGDRAVDLLLLRGREHIQSLEELKSGIGDDEVKRRITNMQNISRQIFEHIEKNPGQSRKINTFMDYYYPTAIKFLTHYAEYDSKGVKSENITGTLQKIRSSLAQFEEAFAHQLDNLYGDKALDIETDIAVLEDIMKREGL